MLLLFQALMKISFPRITVYTERVDSNVYVPRRKEMLSQWTGSKFRLCVMSLMMICFMYGMEVCGI